MNYQVDNKILKPIIIVGIICGTIILLIGHVRFEVLHTSKSANNDTFLPQNNTTRPYLLSTEDKEYIEIRCEWKNRDIF